MSLYLGTIIHYQSISIFSCRMPISMQPWRFKIFRLILGLIEALTSGAIVNFERNLPKLELIEKKVIYKYHKLINKKKFR